LRDTRVELSCGDDHPGEISRLGVWQLPRTDSLPEFIGLIRFFECGSLNPNCHAAFSVAFRLTRAGEHKNRKQGYSATAEARSPKPEARSPKPEANDRLSMNPSPAAFAPLTMSHS